MGANTVTGKGLGGSDKISLVEIINQIQDLKKTLNTLPKIVYTSSKESEPITGETLFTLPSPTIDDADSYIILTGSEDGSATAITSMTDNESGQLTSVTITGDPEVTIFIAVIEKGRYLS